MLTTPAYFCGSSPATRKGSKRGWAWHEIGKKRLLTYKGSVCFFLLVKKESFHDLMEALTIGCSTCIEYRSQDNGSMIGLCPRIKFAWYDTRATEFSVLLLRLASFTPAFFSVHRYGVSTTCPKRYQTLSDIGHSTRATEDEPLNLLRKECRDSLEE